MNIVAEKKQPTGKKLREPVLQLIIAGSWTITVHNSPGQVKDAGTNVTSLMESVATLKINLVGSADI